LSAHRSICKEALFDCGRQRNTHTILPITPETDLERESDTHSSLASQRAPGAFAVMSLTAQFWEASLPQSPSRRGEDGHAQF